MGIENLYAVRYGKGFRFAGENFVFLYYLAKVHKNWLLIDAGFTSGDTADNMGINLIPVEAEIKNIIGDEQISGALITHSHWDHVDGICAFQNIQIYISEDSFEKAIDENSRQVSEYLKKAKADEKIFFLRDGDKIFDAFEYQFIGGHTADSGVFYFCNGGKKFCLAGDECFSLDYVEHNRPIDNAFNLEQNIKFTEQCFREKIIVLPFHDEEIMKRYMSVSENFVKII